MDQPAFNHGLTMAFLELQALNKRYNAVVAVEDFNLSIERGEFVSLLGPSGCGKTTTLQMIAGFTQPTSGKIMLNGRDLGAVPARKRGLGIVFQTYALFPHMTVEQNVGFGLEMRNVPADERRRRVSDALDLVHLSHLGDRFPRNMSGGQRQRVALARALVIEPELLLLDEPLSNLDAKLREEMQLELRRIQQEAGVTTLLVTHDQSEAMALSDRVAVMQSGRLIQEDSPFDVYEKPATSFISTFLGKTNSLPAFLRRKGKKIDIIIDDVRLPGPDTDLPEGPVELSLRPERIELTDEVQATLSGDVVERVFLGDHWLFRVDTPIGKLLVMQRNLGRREAGIGERLHLSWKPEAMRLLPRGEAS
ncbi:MAG: Fe3+/spermidine/putrescine ABC transporter ATP-binding protein [Nitratireductor sp.]|nr:Fe3+/spermidine/putrescine ABC transporter ATP-binding protein [Nitratireductor sp.]